MKKIIFVLLTFFALSTSANACIDPYADVQISISNPYYLSFTGTLLVPQEYLGELGECSSASIDVLVHGTSLQSNLFFMTNFENLNNWSANINIGFDLEPYINAGCSDFTIIFDSVLARGGATAVRELNVHVDGSKNITYNWVTGC
jgi:hypothetical protein